MLYLLLLGSFVVTSSAFYSDFQYVDQIYQNTSNWIFQTSVDFTILQNDIDKLYHDCHQASEALNQLTANVEYFNDQERNLTKYFVLKNEVPHDVAQQQCFKSGPSCTLANLNDEHTFHALTTLLIKNKLNSGHLNYQVERGHVYNKETTLISPTSYIMTRKWNTTLCPNNFTLINNHCILTDFSQVSRTDAEKICQNYNSKLFKLENSNDFATLNKVVTNGESVDAYWLGGDYKNGNYPTASSYFCQEKDAEWIKQPQPEGSRYLAWYRPTNCLLDLEENHQYTTNKIKHHVICSVPPNQIFDMDDKIKIKKMLHYFFEIKKGSFQLSSDGHVSLSYQNMLAAPICSCPSHRKLVTSQDMLAESLIRKTKIVTAIIDQKCSLMKSKIENNPYLSSIDKHDKRWIGSAIRSALSRAKLALTSSNFVPRLKTISKVTGTAAAIGITGVAIQDVVSTQNFHQEVIEKLDNPITHLQHTSATPNYHYGTQHFRNTKDDLNNQFLRNISNSVLMNTDFETISISLDNILIFFNSVNHHVITQYNSFMNVVDSIISNIPTNNVQLHKAILKTSQKLPNKFSFISDNIHDILKSSEVFHHINDTHLTAYINTPIINKESSLSLFKAMALPYKTKSGKAILPHFESMYMAVTSKYNYYTLLHGQELISCKKGDHYICTNMELYTKSSKTCTYAHFLGDNIEATKICNFYELKDSNYFKLASDHTLYYYVPKHTKAMIICLTNSTMTYKTTITLMDTGKYKIPNGCSIETENFYAQNPSFPNGYKLPQIVSPIMNYNKLVDLPEDTSFYDNIYIKSGIPALITTTLMPQIISIIIIIIISIISICACMIGMKKIIYHLRTRYSNQGANTFTVEVDNEVYDPSLFEIIPMNRPQTSSTRNQMDGETTPKPKKPDELDATMTFKFDTEIHDRN